MLPASCKRERQRCSAITVVKMLPLENCKASWSARPGSQACSSTHMPIHAGRILQQPICTCPRSQDVQYATLLSEMAYRAVDCSDEASWRAAKSFVEAEVGCSLPEVQRHRSGGQRYRCCCSQSTRWLSCMLHAVSLYRPCLFLRTVSAVFIWALASKDDNSSSLRHNCRLAVQLSVLRSTTCRYTHGIGVKLCYQQLASPSFPGCACRYLVGETENAIYVAFQGTKHVTDWLANLNFIHAPLWHHRQRYNSSKSDANSSSSSSSSNGSSWSIDRDSSSRSSRAHVGFIRRANQSALSISALQQSAAATGKRLVLTGHSLGGAVATLTTVRLLRSLHTAQPLGESSSHQDPQIRCISFATPAVANTDLLQEVAEAGWDKYITNIVLPGRWRRGCSKLILSRVP